MADVNAVLTSSTLLRELKNPEKREAAWRTFLERYRPLIVGWCLRAGLNGADAEEASADVLGKLVKALPQFVRDPSRRFRGWLKTVVENEVRTLWRQRARRPGDRASGDPAVQDRLDALAAPESLDDLVLRLDESLRRDLERADVAVARVRRRVKPTTWEAFWRTAIEGEPAGDVARQLGLQVTAVYVAKRRVHQMLREEGDRLAGPDRRGAEDGE